jgi:hypothetical protein
MHISLPPAYMVGSGFGEFRPLPARRSAVGLEKRGVIRVSSISIHAFSINRACTRVPPTYQKARAEAWNRWVIPVQNGSACTPYCLPAATAGLLGSRRADRAAPKPPGSCCRSFWESQRSRRHGGVRPELESGSPRGRWSTTQSRRAYLLQMQPLVIERLGQLFAFHLGFYNNKKRKKRRSQRCALFNLSALFPARLCAHLLRTP